MSTKQGNEMKQEIKELALELAAANLAYAQACVAEDAFLQNKFFDQMVMMQNMLNQACMDAAKL